ncbi:DUF3180 domain-containing protein [Parasphingorhabdus pacifica]
MTQARQLIAVALVGAVLAYLGIRVSYGALPTLPMLAGATLLLLALVDVVLAVVVRPRIKRRAGTEPLESLTAARLVALAKTSSLAGAIMGGVWIGLLLFLVPRMEVLEAARSDTASAGIGLFSAVALIGAGLWLENCLRNPDEPEEPYDDE